MIPFTQSTAALHKYLNDEIKLLCLLQFFPQGAQNSLSFPCSEKYLSIPCFPGLWPPWTMPTNYTSLFLDICRKLSANLGNLP